MVYSKVGFFECERGSSHCLAQFARQPAAPTSGDAARSTLCVSRHLKFAAYHGTAYSAAATAAAIAAATAALARVEVQSPLVLCLCATLGAAEDAAADARQASLARAPPTGQPGPAHPSLYVRDSCEGRLGG